MLFPMAEEARVNTDLRSNYPVQYVSKGNYASGMLDFGIDLKI